MKLKSNVAASEAGFIFNPSTGDSFTTNSVGSEILFLIKEHKSVPEIKKIFLEKYDVDNINFEKDLEDFISQLKDNNLLEI